MKKVVLIGLFLFVMIFPLAAFASEMPPWTPEFEQSWGAPSPRLPPSDFVFPLSNDVIRANAGWEVFFRMEYTTTTAVDGQTFDYAIYGSPVGTVSKSYTSLGQNRWEFVLRFECFPPESREVVILVPRQGESLTITSAYMASHSPK